MEESRSEILEKGEKPVVKGEGSGGESKGSRNVRRVYGDDSGGGSRRGGRGDRGRGVGRVGGGKGGGKNTFYNLYISYIYIYIKYIYIYK